MEDCLQTNNCALTPEYVREHLEVFQQADGGITNIYRDCDGKMESTIYQLYAGVTLIRKDVKRSCFLTNWREKPEQGIVIEHCWKGRLECRNGASYMYPAPGDLILYKKDYHSYMQQYPMGYFYSLAISINFDTLEPRFKKLLEKLEFSMESLVEKYNLYTDFYNILTENTQFARIFEEIHTAPKNAQINYWKIKLFEMLLLLHSKNLEKNKLEESHVSKLQASSAKEARQYLLEHPFERITIEELAKKLMVSQSYLKAGFRLVYGTSIKQFDRDYKMQLAAEMLRETELQIGDIARQFDYVNVSKFSSSFQAVHGMNPSEYRKKHKIG